MRHVLKAAPDTIHWGHYDSRIKPVLRIKSGDTVEVQTVSGDTPPEVLEKLGVSRQDIPESFIRIHEEVKDRGPGSHILNGPMFVEDAKPGDVLEVRIREVEPSASFGYAVFRPGLGTLPENYPYTAVRIIRLDLMNRTGEFIPGIRVPLRPFFGQLGVAPPEDRVSSILPGAHGGNLDNKELIAGSTLYLPVKVEGALLSIGDGHAAQGDGEVCDTAIECSMRGVLEIHLRRDMRLNWPLGETPTHIITMGLHEDLDEAAKMAVRNTISYLVSNQGLNRDDAYMLSSQSVDFHITQLVNGAKGVHGLIPKTVLRKSQM